MKKAIPATTQASLPATVDESLFQPGEGLEAITQRDILIPRLVALQDLSPQLKKSKPEFVAGAEAGMICDVATGELYGRSLLFLPTLYRKDFLEWAPRASGKGLVGFHTDPAILEQCTRDGESGRMQLRNGNNIVETAQFFGINLSSNSRRKQFLPFASTQLKRARKWATLADGVRLDSGEKAPLYYCVYQLETVEESNAQGTWFGWKVSLHSKTAQWCSANHQDLMPLVRAARAFNEILRSGAARAELTGDDEGGDEATHEKRL